MERDEPELYVAADLLLAQAAGPALAGESALWAQKLGRAQRELRAALEVCAANRLKDALALLKDVIDRQLSRTKHPPGRRRRRARSGHAGRRAAHGLRPARRIARDPGAAGRLDDFRRGVDALAGLDRRLTTAVGLHTAFQEEIDDELRLRSGAARASPAAWRRPRQDLAPLRRAICESNPAEWAAKLTRLAADLEVALAAADVLRLRRSFGRYRSQAVQLHQVDHDLMSLCAELQQVGALAQVLRVLE